MNAGENILVRNRVAIEVSGAQTRSTSTTRLAMDAQHVLTRRKSYDSCASESIGLAAFAQHCIQLVSATLNMWLVISNLA